MGTRSLTFVYDDSNTPIINLYRQFDGYREGHGQELADFLGSFDEITNGISFGEERKTANGMGCLAAQLVAHFKVGVGGFYLYPTKQNALWQDYEYHIYENEVKVVCYDNTIFKGTWQEFHTWAHTDEPNYDDAEDQDELKDKLKKGIVSVSFIKVDGSTRNMRCTLSEDYIVPTDTTKVPTRTKVQNDEVLAVWDVDANGWRSFRWDSIQSVSVGV
jgi:hypothetical protein